MKKKEAKIRYPKTRGPVPKSNPKLVTFFSVKGRAEYTRWFARLRDRIGMNHAEIFDHIVRELAEAAGFEEPPPRTYIADERNSFIKFDKKIDEPVKSTQTESLK